MKPKRIILIRHGESEGNVDGSVYGLKPDYALLLTDKGKQQARDAGKKLRTMIGDETVRFYVSPLFRTRQTHQEIARAFAEGQFVSSQEPRLREQEWGHLRGPEERDTVERDRNEYGTFYFRIPDGESGADVFDRVSDFFGTLFRDFEKPSFPQNAVMVTHGMTIRLFLMRWFHYTVEKFERLGNPENCAIVTLELQKDGKYELTTEMREREAQHQWRLEE